MSKKKSLLILAGLLIFVGGLVAFEHDDLPQERSPDALGPQEVAYVFSCDGHYLRLDTKAGRVLATGPAGGLAASTSHQDGCLVNAVQIDSQAGLVYAVVPTTSVVDTNGQRSYRVVALQLPDLKVVNSRLIPTPLDEVPQLLFDDRDRSVVLTYAAPSQTSSESAASKLEWLSPITLKVATSTPDDRLRNAVPLAMGAYLDRSGRIIDGNSVLDPNGTVTVVNGYDLLTDSVSREFEGLKRVGVTGKKYLDIVLADSADDRMLFIVGWDTQSNPSPAGGGLLAYDAVKGRVVGTVMTPYREAPFDGTVGTPTVHLTPDGDRMVVEEYRWQQPDPGGTLRETQERFKTGVIAVYDVGDGKLIETIQLNPVPGYSGRVLGFSADSQLMYYASEQDIYIVNLAEAGVRTTSLPPRFLPTAVVTADR